MYTNDAPPPWREIAASTTENTKEIHNIILYNRKVKVR